MKIIIKASLLLITTIFSVSASAANYVKTEMNQEESKVKNVLIIGANGQTSAVIIPRLLDLKNVNLCLFLRDASRLNNLKSDRVRLFEGDATREKDLERAMEGQDIVISTMGGMDLDTKTANITKAMKDNNVHRIIVFSAGGIWNELPEPFNTWDKAIVGSYRPINRKTAEIVEASNLDYTVLRPVWLNNKKIEKYTITYKGDVYKGRSTSRASIANLIQEIVKEPSLYSRKDIGISQTGDE